MKLYPKIKSFVKKLFFLEDSPHKIAAGLAFGIFLGIIPGEGVTAALIFSSLFGFNRLSAISGALATNMWSTLAILPLAAKTGALISDESYSNLVQHFKSFNYTSSYKFFLSKYILFEIALPLVLGFVLWALIFSLLSYLIFWLLLRHKKIIIQRFKL